MDVVNRFDLSGRTAVVTGASRGIGAAIAVALGEAGADVIGVARSMQNDGDVADRVRAHGRRFEPIAADLSDRDETRGLARRLAAEPPDILVLNHGVSRRAASPAEDESAWDLMMEVNLNSYWVLGRMIGREMATRGSGKIIATASMLSFHGGLGAPGYAASKHGVAGMVKALSNEWAGAGVQVNAIAPGFIDTEMNAPLFANEVRSKQLFDRIPAERWGRPDDMCGAAVFLASDASAYVSGIVLPVDGGWLAA